ncbi:hypothetical protein [Flagellimonas pacifica]|uniref:SGNH/GDSL hydrolase family protein n=1 Tax=Flagellimonas pacifica TaxID=1247520 RepID=A0A285MFW5_9FLAO|nr:hypothetical protein [Allomuricauda parva]SNY95367.1 hypothetical protein SAMN06265377_1035 [Allomuricauda parva]
MKKLVIKSIVYFVSILVVLELLARVFHLHSEDPQRFIDPNEVEKRVPNSEGFAVTGNRNQNFSKFRINHSGFNSFREFNPSFSNTEIALIGDSFIEGFHEDYDKSIGKKIEEQLNNKTEVYEYGYAGYDLSNQLHLLQAYAEEFEKIDYIIIYLDYRTDLNRDTYTPDRERIQTLASPIFKIRDRFKIILYASRIGVLDPIQELIIKATPQKKAIESKWNHEENRDSLLLNNFKTLCSKYPINYTKTFFLIDGRKTPSSFLDYCNVNNIKYLDYGKIFKETDLPTTLIYDQHWNNHGRSLIAKLISDSLPTKD